MAVLLKTSNIKTNIKNYVNDLGIGESLYISNLFLPILKMLKFPKELLTLSILKPISGSSSLIVYNDILKVHGPDSFIGRVASVIHGSTDTTIYIISLYFSSIGVKKIKYSLIVGFLSDIICIVIAIITISIIFK